MTKLYVGNLPSELTGEDLRQLFSFKGFLVDSARVICDREGGRSRGFGFVEIESAEDAEQAIAQLDGFNMNGRALLLKDACPASSRGERS
jgi:RNA recognition motif-containing protein